MTLVRKEIMCAGCSAFDTLSGEREEIALSRFAGSYPRTGGGPAPSGEREEIALSRSAGEGWGEGGASPG
jgi:hypothetical protein